MRSPQPRAVVAASLTSYDGSAGVLVDTNVWVDCIDTASPWHGWAVEQLQLCGERAPLHVNLVIYTELLVPGPDVEALDELLDVYDVRRSSLPWACAALTARAFSLYRRRGGARLLPLPDFFIGAHAAVANLSVLTRDPSGYSTYFPRLSLLAP
jgi:predicted nucleic acid-binding protein